MEKLEAIPTYYKGYHFRSRLEARWAVFFDAIGAQWEYEPEGFTRNGISYLPDFRVKCWCRWPREEGALIDLYVEVKADVDKISKAEYEKIMEFAGFEYVTDEEGQIVRLDDSPILAKERIPVLVVTGLPGPEHWRWWIEDRWDHVLYSGKRGNLRAYNFDIVDGDWYAAYPCISDDGKFILAGSSHDFFDRVDMQRTADAYAAARSARFEHGERGRT